MIFKGQREINMARGIKIIALSINSHEQIQ